MFDSNRDGLVISVPAIVKAHLTKSGQRLVEVQASSESCDDEGDVIEQKALLDSANAFVKNGHLDIDHLSELGDRLGLPNPESYIVGRPTEVKNIGDGKTSVVGEIRRSATGEHDPFHNRYDAFWDSLHSNPPVKWRASVYGFPPHDAVEDCRGKICASGARRYHIKALDWRSLAFTKHPINTALTGYAKVVSAKSYLASFIAKAGSLPPPISLGSSPPEIAHFDLSDPTATQSFWPAVTDSRLDSVNPANSPAAPAVAMAMPRSLEDAVGQYHTHLARGDCPHSGGINSVVGFRNHFERCCGMKSTHADLFAHALMYFLARAARRAA